MVGISSKKRFAQVGCACQEGIAILFTVVYDADISSRLGNLMGLQVDRDKFFEGFKEHFDPTLTQDQVDGLNTLLDEIEADPLYHTVPPVAYMLATTYHETAGAMAPVEEGYYLKTPARVKRFQKTLRYYPYFGRGDVQLTWETKGKPNYSKATRKLREKRPHVVAEFEARTGQTFDMVKNPDQALDPQIAYHVMSLGMFEGWFTGRKFGDYITAAGKADYTGMRAIINGTDKAGLIAGYARWFERILRAAGVGPESGASPEPSGTKPGSDTSTPSGEANPDQSGSTQVADTIVNTGGAQQNVPPPEDKIIEAPAPMGTVPNATKVTIGSIVVPPVIVAIVRSIQDLVSQGYLDAREIGNSVINLFQQNFKYILILAVAVIAVLAIKHITRYLIFLVTVITHAIPGWNSITIVGSPQPQPQPRAWWKFW